MILFEKFISHFLFNQTFLSSDISKLSSKNFFDIKIDLEYVSAKSEKFDLGGYQFLGDECKLNNYY